MNSKVSLDQPAQWVRRLNTQAEMTETLVKYQEGAGSHTGGKHMRATSGSIWNEIKQEIITDKNSRHTNRILAVCVGCDLI